MTTERTTCTHPVLNPSSSASTGFGARESLSALLYVVVSSNLTQEAGEQERYLGTVLTASSQQSSRDANTRQWHVVLVKAKVPRDDSTLTSSRIHTFL